VHHTILEQSKAFIWRLPPFNRLRRKSIFRDHYKFNHWKNGESVSGDGSTLDATLAVREELPALLARYDIKSLLDVPCGDLHWARTMDWTGTRYIGADIVPEIIASHKATQPITGAQFHQLDLTEDKLPDADVILCRDCLVHLPNIDVMNALLNIKRSGAKYLLTTTFDARKENADILAGQWRPINLQAAPFNLAPPTDFIDERCLEEDGQFNDKKLALWEISKL